MFKYPISNRDAMRSIMVRVPAAGVTFTDPALNQFFADEREGLCRITVRRVKPIATGPEAVNYIEVHYEDPELEFMRALGAGNAF